MKKIIKALLHPRIVFLYILETSGSRLLPDKIYLKLKYFLKLNKKLNLDYPVTFNEKLQWLKLYNRKPEYSVMVDKYRMRSYVADRIGLGHTVPLIGVWEDPAEIDFDKLPNKFVLKCNHNSGLGMCICKDKSNLDVKKVKSELKKGLRQNYYLTGREWPYKDVPRKVFAEEYLEESQSDVLTDYKFFCFNGVPKIMYISQDNAKEPHTDFFDMDFNHLNIRMKDPNSEISPNKPKQFEKMKQLATILAKDVAHLRVDFYVVNDNIYVGELTFFHNSGFSNITPEQWENTLGEWIKLPEKSC